MKRILALLIILTMAFACPALAEGVREMLDKAAAYIESGEYEKALACYELARRVDPEAEEAYLGEINLRLMMADEAGAAELIDEALKMNPLSASAWLLKCRADVLRGDAAAFEADAMFAEVCGVDFVPIAASVAAMYALKGKNDRAALFFDMTDIHALTDDERMLYRRALIAEGRRSEAEALGLTATAWHDTALDAAFEADALTLIRAEMPVITADDFELPEAMWAALETDKPDDPYTQLAEALKTAVITPLSLSPSGNSGILIADDSTWIAQYNGVYRLIYPAFARGVADEYGNFKKYAITPLRNLLGEEGVVYSSDGRYAAIYNVRLSLINAQFFLDPILIDLSTGEMFLTATYPVKIRLENAGVVTTACFSADNRYFYYNMFGSFGEYRSALFRYDLESGTTERCYSWNGFTYYPTLSETADGAFLMIRDTNKQDEKTGVVTARYADGRWDEQAYMSEMPMRYWQMNRLQYSVNSGYAITPGRNSMSNGLYTAFQCFCPDNDFDGFNRILTVPKNGGAIEEVSVDSFVSAMDAKNADDVAALEFSLSAFPYQTILCARLSPDGFYALLCAQNHNLSDTSASRHLYLARLADGALREVRGIDPQSILAGSIGYRYSPTIEWNTDRLIIITDEGILTYRFDFSAQ